MHPVQAIAASPGAGKSRVTGKAIAALQAPELKGDILLHAPTLALCDEAADHLRGSGCAAVQVARGRSAPVSPGSSERMCRKAELAERLGRLCYNVTRSLCVQVERTTGAEARCPYFQTCAYWRNMGALSEEPQHRAMPTSYLPLDRDPDRPVALRVIDETFWAGLLRQTDLRVDVFVARRDPQGEDAAAKQIAVRVTRAARAVFYAVKRPRRDPLRLPDTAEDFWNAGDEPARILEIISPAGIEEFFRELVALGGVAQVQPQVFDGLCDRFGLEMRPETVPGLCARFGLAFPGEPVV